MDKTKALEIIKIEKQCIWRNIHRECDRRCLYCDLIREDSDILEAYDYVIAALSGTNVEVKNATA